MAPKRKRRRFRNVLFLVGLDGGHPKTNDFVPDFLSRNGQLRFVKAETGLRERKFVFG